MVVVVLNSTSMLLAAAVGDGGGGDGDVSQVDCGLCCGVVVVVWCWI